MTTTIKVEGLDTLRPELDALAQEHYREIALYQDRIALAPNWHTYAGLERRGELVSLGVRVEGVLVGYALWVLRTHLHYEGCLTALNDVIYLHPNHRRGRTGLRLIDESEYILKVLGVDHILWHLKPSHDWSNILKRKGYALEEMIYGKVT